MDSLRLDLMMLDDHLNYPENCVSAEGDAQHLDLISRNFQSQSDHPDAEGLAFEVRLLPNDGIGKKAMGSSFHIQDTNTTRI